MLKLKMISLVWALALIAMVPVYADTIFVAGGDDAGLVAAIAALPPGGNIIIEPSGVFTAPVTLGTADSEKKIMAAPGVVAVFDGGGASGPGFTIAGAQNVVLENLKITAWGTDGVFVMNNSSAKLINLQITKCGAAAVHGSGTSTVEVEGSRLLNNGIGVLLENVGAQLASGTIEKTQIRNNRGWGVMFRGLPAGTRNGQVKIWHCMIDKNGGDGVRIMERNHATLNNNDIAFNGGNGVIFEPRALGSLSFNTIAYNATAGLSYANATVNVSPGNNTIAGNAPNVVGPALPATNQVGP